MKIGDLIYDEQYGHGIVTSACLEEPFHPGVFITFAEGRRCFLAKSLFDSVELISENR